ncbi:MAG: GGDEF domain-containing protein [Fuerstiella sp.]|nr:GGDEF domain-containing protein [Fuerstiella sp.]
MTSRDPSHNAIADTRIELSGSANAVSTTDGPGCLLQIYPVPDIPGLMRLGSGRSVLGRDDTCDITIDDSSVSRMHATVEWSNDTYCITDLNSTNGSWINGTKLAPQTPLAGGELIRLGNTILKFMMSPDEEVQYHKFVHELMARDSLTNTFNRAWLMPLLGRELKNCRQESFELSIVFIDIDRFKRTNDKCGHLIGDEVLRTFCDRIRPVLDTTYSLCRFGGDEFVVVCPHSPLTIAEKVAEMIRQTISKSPFQTQAGQLKITCSMGVTCTDGHSLSDVDSLLSAADELLYRAKAQGRNCIHRANGDAMSRSRTAST